MFVQELPLESEWILKAISHNTRQEILNLIAEKKVQSYTYLMQKLNLSTGKLNFHLKQLTGLIEKQTDGNYKLTEIGFKAIDILKQINSFTGNEDNKKQLRSIILGKSLRQFEPAPETKKKWYFWTVLIYCLVIWLPLIITEVVKEYNPFNIILEKKLVRNVVYLSIITVFLLFLIILSFFLVKKYLETIKYEVLDTEIAIVKGLFVRKRTIIPFRTITNLVITQGPLDFLFGISNVIIQTAGESAKSEPEGKLVGIYYANDLIEEILNLVRLLDPPSYLRERLAISTTSENITLLYSQILLELQKIAENLPK
ncbi:MAG: PH domain-containing protein [Candidatus Heimdallarchaeota archaeon]|nr:PH domain-containing protein [Candidatus Heimdallarchaeota archaeon]